MTSKIVEKGAQTKQFGNHCFCR